MEYAPGTYAGLLCLFDAQFLAQAVGLGALYDARGRFLICLHGGCCHRSFSLAAFVGHADKGH